MKRVRGILAFLIAIIGFGTPGCGVAGSFLGGGGFVGLQSVPASKVALNDPFWAPRIETNRTASLPMMYQSFIDNHNLDNFAKVAGMPGNHDGFLWCDSDVYKTLEGMARAIELHPDSNLQGKLENAIDLIVAAQIGSGPMAGYIDTYFQLGNIGRGGGGTTVTTQPWEDLKAMHEDYCHGHLIEAALAHHKTTGTTKFLTVARKLADHLESVFGNGKRSGVPGHQEVEIALMKLWALQGKQADLDLAKFYIDERGRHSGGRGIYGEYCQDLAPIRSFTEPVGHAVRGPYMWAGATDVAAATGDGALLGALETTWKNVVERKMHATGGTGQAMYNEGYGPDYDLSNDWAYNETCSACATIWWSQRMANQLGDAKYIDVMERILYNGFAAGRSIDGTRLYYNNFMTRYGDKGRMGIACCATNIVRMVPSVGGFQYATKEGDGIWTHLYMAGQAEVSYGGGTVGLKQETTYPWDGAVKLTVTLPGSSAFAINFRIPEWAGGATVSVNGAGVDLSAVSKGYLPISRTWQNGDVINLNLPMNVRRVYPNAKSVSNQGRVAIARGPIVFCLEGNDNPISVHKIVVPSGAALNASYDGGLLGGVVKVTGNGTNADNGSSVGFTMIPYAVWDNRNHDSQMCVMVPENGADAPQKLDKGRVGNATVTYSYKNGGDTAAAVNDGIWPKGSNDQSIPRFTWWSHQGTSEWIAYEFPAPMSVWRSDIYWFSDAEGGGGCDFPASFSHEYWDGSNWQPVTILHDYAHTNDLYSGGHYTIVRFSPVTTTKLRLTVQLKANKSGGILEWRVPE